MPRVAALLALVTAVCLFGSAPAHAAQEGPRRDHITRSSDGVYVLGDSLTFHGRGPLRRLQPAWSINGVGGRPVNAMPRLIRNVLRVDRDPAAVVIALGSNQSTGWTQRDLRRAVALLPEETYVVMPTTFKTGKRWARVGRLATQRYNRWMTRLAAQRPNTCTAPWRETVAADRSLLVDGLHATTEGYRLRAHLIIDTLFNCE